MSNTLSNALFGLNHDHLTACADAPGHFVNLEAQSQLKALTAAAGEAGFALKLASSFRPFERQLAIFNGKFNGQRPILDLKGNIVDISTLDDWSICQAILLYSALPGSSRHHWGTDFDFYDGNALEPDYQIQLIEAEYSHDGPFAPLSQWLSLHASEFGFFFPYRDFKGGVASEAWHISYAPIAEHYLSQLTAERLTAQIEQSDIAAKATILANIEVIFQRYINNIAAFDHIVHKSRKGKIT